MRSHRIPNCLFVSPSPILRSSLLTTRLSVHVDRRTNHSSATAAPTTTHTTTIAATRARQKQSAVTMKRRASKRNQELSAVDHLQVAGYRISGISVAAVETCIWIPSLSIAFDAGKSPRGAIPMKYMAITHGHCDHVHGLPLHAATRSLQKMETGTYIVPEEIIDDVKELIHVVGKLERIQIKANVISLPSSSSPSSSSASSSSMSSSYIHLGKGYYLNCFKTAHTVPSQGYVVYKKKKKLKSEYTNLSRDELVALKKSAKNSKDIEIDYDLYTPEIVFTGDTNISGIEQNEECRNTKILITELTFINDERTPLEAFEMGHIHIQDVIDKSYLFEKNEYIVFTHFSARYSKQQIRDAIDSLPAQLKCKCIALGASGDTSDSE